MTNSMGDEVVSQRPAKISQPGRFRRVIAALTLLSGFGILVWMLLDAHVQTRMTIAQRLQNSASSIELSSNFFADGHTESSRRIENAAHISIKTNWARQIAWLLGGWAAVLAGLWLWKPRSRSWVVVPIAPAIWLTTAVILQPFTPLPEPPKTTCITMVIKVEPSLAPALQQSELETMRKALQREAMLSVLPTGGLAETLRSQAWEHIRKVELEAVNDSSEKPSTGFRCTVDLALDGDQAKALAAFYDYFLQLQFTDRLTRRPDAIPRREWDPAIRDWLEPWLQQQELLQKQVPTKR